MTLISLIVIMHCHHYSRGLRRAFSEHQGWATHLGFHDGEESQRLDYLVRSLTWTCGSWDLHKVFQPTSCVCDECRWHSVNRPRSCSGRIGSPMLLAVVEGHRVSLFPHLNACRESLSTGCNFPPTAKSPAMPTAPKMELNTIQQEEYTQSYA
jgi:hypothetical protein